MLCCDRQPHPGLEDERQRGPGVGSTQGHAEPSGNRMLVRRQSTRAEASGSQRWCPRAERGERYVYIQTLPDEQMGMF